MRTLVALTRLLCFALCFATGFALSSAAPECSGAALDSVLTLASGEQSLYVGDVFEVEARVRNQLDRPLRVWLVPSVSSRVALLDGPTTLELPAGGDAIARYVLEGREAGAAALQLLAYACDPASGDVPAAGQPASVRVTLAAVPKLPAPNLSTVVTVDLAARHLPVLDGLGLVSRLPDGARYALGSSRVDGEGVDDPREVDGALVFDLAGRAAAQVSYAVLHDDTIVSSDADHTLIARTPEPEVLIGDPEGLELYRRVLGDVARNLPDEDEPADPGRGDVDDHDRRGDRDDTRGGAHAGAPQVDRARVGPAILTPADDSLVRSGRVTRVTVAAGLGHVVRLFVNDELVPDDRVGRLVRDAGLGRQTLDYIGVTLRAGPNTLRLESEHGGNVERDEVVVFLAGAPATIGIEAVSPLVAGTVATLRFEITVTDAWGMVPSDSFVTVDVAGGSIASPDADPRQAGHQVAFRDGRGVLELAPVASPGRFAITAAVGLAEAEVAFEVAAEARPWIVNGLGSLGVHYRDGLRFGASGSVFARGAVLGDALLTLAAQAPLEPLGLQEDPYERFPVVGSSGAQSADAHSRHGVFARLERGQDFVQYGDFTAHFVGAFHSARSYTGLSGGWSDASGFGVQAYAAYVPVRDVVSDVELPSDGTSAYRLPHAQVLPGTLRLEVIKRDRFDGRLLLDDGDPLVRVLQPAADYAVDEVVGVVLLTRPLPLEDGEGNSYSLRASYRLTSVDDAPPFPQFGVQASYDLGDVTVRASLSQETRGVGEFERLAAASVAVDLGAVTADLDVGFGSDENAGGLGVALGVRYAEGPLRSEAEYRFWGVGYRGGGVTDDTRAGHAVKLGGAYALTPEWTLVASGRWHSFTRSDEGDFDGRLSAAYQGRDDVRLGDLLVGTRPRMEVGAQADARGVRALGSVAVRDVLGLAGSEVRVAHLQGLGAGVTSVTDLSVAYRLSDALEVRLTDRITWGQGHALLLGLQSGFEHAALTRLACQSGIASCDLDGALPLGRSTVVAEYEIPGGVSPTAGSLRVGLDTRYPLTERLRLEGSAAQLVDLSEPMRNATVLTAGIAFDGDAMDASARYEVRFTPDSAKQVATLGATGALGAATFASVQVRYLDDPAATVRQGFGVSLAAAYRGDRVSLLTHHQGRFGNLQTLGEREFEGDMRVSWTMTPAWELRAGHAYQLLPGDGFVDLWSIGVAAHPWAGGSVGAYGRLFHDWDAGDSSPGLGLEVAQALGCGLYGVAGVNAWSGVGADRGAVFGQPGAYLRVDVVFDENWRCGRLREGEGP